MASTQSRFRVMMTMAMAAMMNGGKLKRKEKRWGLEELTSDFGKSDYVGSPRFMLTLPRPGLPKRRSPEAKARKLRMRMEKRSRIEARGF
ncbi:MAG: hypothetical protein KAV87_55510 [Desulfobacteraceae bacterium]|nr:hypothetical protein [Desulfobacteraceae bacterium]